MQNLINAIRTDSKVGAGSCSSIDECWDDEDLKYLIADAGAQTPAQAVKVARKYEALRNDAIAGCQYE